MVSYAKISNALMYLIFVLIFVWRKICSFRCKTSKKFSSNIFSNEKKSSLNVCSAFFAASMHFHFYFHLLLVYERWILNWEIASKDSHNFALGVMSSNLIELKFICRLILCELMRKATLEFLSIIVGNKFAGTLLKMIERWFQALKLVIMTFSGIYIVARYAWSSSPYSIFTILRE